MSKKDAQIKDTIGFLHRKFTRRGFLGKLSILFASLIAFLTFGNGRVLAEKMASNTCYPPQGRFCSGCSSVGACPSGFSTCTPSNYKCSQCRNWCPYTSGWWATTDGYVCRDCISNSSFSCGSLNSNCTNNTYYCGCRSQHAVIQYQPDFS